MADPALNSDAILADRLTQFNRAANGADDPAVILPAGRCNYHDLTQGPNAQTCGCNSFWLNDLVLQEQDIQTSQQSSLKRATCFCGHHACFHAAERVDIQQSGNNYLTAQTPLEFHGSAVFRTQNQNSTSRRGIEAQNSVRGLNSFAGQHNGAAYQQVPQDVVELPDHGYVPDPQNETQGLGLFAARNSTLRAYNAQLPANGTYNLDDTPNLYSQFRVPQSPYTNVHPQAGNVFAPYPIPPPTQASTLPDTAPYESGSATEVATPSVSGVPVSGFPPDHLASSPQPIDRFTQTMAAMNRAFVSQSDARSTISKSSRQPNRVVQNTNTLSTANQQISTAEWSQFTSKILLEIASLKEDRFKTAERDKLMKHIHQRLERLETASFSHVTDQEVSDRFESFEARLIEVVSRVEELENFREFFNNNSAASETDSFRQRYEMPKSQSRGSTSRKEHQRESSHTSRMPDLNQIGGFLQRLESVEAVISRSVGNPWEIEVVLLPWNPELSGIWFGGLDASQASFSLNERSVASNIAVKPYNDGRYSSMATQEWSGAAMNRLSPRACGPTEGTGGVVYNRLRSRGFVQRVMLEARDASSIYAAISNAFTKLLQTLNTPFASALSNSQQERAPIGLQGDFVPLRKVHKSSRLRYLSDAELAAPSCWTADFLDSSVFMKAAGGLRRLYITQPAAYFQHPHVDTTVPILASWQAIRELPRFKAGSSAESSFVGEGDAREKCWLFNPRLDPSESTHSSFSSAKQGNHSASEPLSPEYSMADAGQNEDMSSEEESQGQSAHWVTRPSIPPITPITDFSTSQARRSVSLPITQELVPVQISNAPKRNATSFNAINPTRKDSMSDQQLKRRRQSPSSGEESTRRASQRAFQNPTPRQSREPPSPESNTMQDPRWNREDIGSVIPRGPTPVPYATPYSNNNMEPDWRMQHEEYPNSIADNERTSNQRAGKRHADDDAWHGVSESEHDMQYSDDEEDDEDDDLEDASDSEMSQDDENDDMVDDEDDDEDDDDEDEDDAVDIE